MLTKAELERFSDSLVSEIKAEMGRRDWSSRRLGREIGKSSQYMSDRLDGGSSKTGKRVVMTVTDLAAIAEALRVSPVILIERALSASAEDLDAGHRSLHVAGEVEAPRSE